MIEKGTACNVSCIERHVERRDTRVSQVLQGEGLMGDMTQNKGDERTRRLSNISPTLPETEIATFEIFDELDEFDSRVKHNCHMILILSMLLNPSHMNSSPRRKIGRLVLSMKIYPYTLRNEFLMT